MQDVSAPSLDPETWPDPVQVRALWISMAGLVIAGWLLAGTPLHILPLAAFPIVFGGLIWRFDGLPWIDIASWTLPATLSVAVANLMIPLPATVVATGAVMAAWIYGFIFWTRVTHWWYERVLRKPYPPLPRRSRS